MPPQRPSPEKLLKRIKKAELLERRGKLKIYLGAAPGVGKTYTMLQDAMNKRAQGLDVVVGVAESHGREEIDALLKNFEILPKQTVEYRSRLLTEFDLDAALRRQPGLILIDEMAHTNVPGVRHSKRWQDIRELLDRGIDVYTTLNVQHIESLNDVVSQIIHSRIKETIPDSMLELADTIELIDLPPEELIKRLQEGKVYFPGQVELARENFFRKGNLTALRELALRVTAERVDTEVLLYRQDLGIRHIWPTKEKILVCVGFSTESTKLIRAAKRTANNLQAEWIAVHVDTPRLRLSEVEHNNAIQNLRLAEQLGADTRILTGFDVVKEIVDYAREQNVTQILVGKHNRPWWKKLFSKSLTNEIIQHCDEIDVCIINSDTMFVQPTKPLQTKSSIPWRIYAISLLIVAIATTIDLLLYPMMTTSNLIMVYLLGTCIIALFGQAGPSISASVVSVLAYDFFFIPPFFSLEIADIQYFFTLVVMLLVTQVISYLTILTRQQAEASQFAEHQTATLHTLSRQLASTRGVDKLIQIGVRYIADVFDSEVLGLLPENNQLTIRARYQTEQVLDTKEQGVAQWVYDLGQVAGLGTDTLPFSAALYVPLLASQGALGVLRVRPIKTGYLFTPEQMHLLEMCTNQIALALEVDRLQEQAKESELQMETDRVRSALLEAVSHDLRTPLVVVMGAASTLMEMSTELDAQKVKKLGKDIYFELEQLNRLINNLLQITYLEADVAKLQKKPHSLKTLIQQVIEESNKKLGKKLVHIQLPTDLPEIPFDETLMHEVFINLIDNVIKFTPPETPIDIAASIEKKHILISVADYGPGIVPDEVNKLFEKFYRGRMLTTERGLGLGLAICRSVIKAHGGEIWAENRPQSGAVFYFTLPLVE